MRYVILSALLAAPALADPPTIEQVRASATGDTWRFDVTIRHPDTGWDHYADGWRVLDMDGNELGLRVLHHFAPELRRSRSIAVKEPLRSKIPYRPLEEVRLHILHSRENLAQLTPETPGEGRRPSTTKARARSSDNKQQPSPRQVLQTRFHTKPPW